MQLKKILVSAIISLSIFSAVANANIRVFSDSHTENLCANVEGKWIGSGTVTARVMGMKVSCDYAGQSFITGSENFSANIDLQLSSGICPSSENFILPGTCDSATGAITLQSDDANLTGTLSNNGTQANFTGTVNIPIMGKTVVATVERMELHKV
ncbi:MAG TPA: hypothetical protein VHM20_04025 [Gammaproteobacteria bacterium]|nr:hypothetical protein [Gammaproteobacteria bacterium]